MRRPRTRFETIFTVLPRDQNVASVWGACGFRVNAFRQTYTRAADVWRCRVASTSWWIAGKIFKKDENRAFAFAYYTRAAMASAMSLCVRASQNWAKHPNTRHRERVARRCVSTHVYQGRGRLAISCCVDFVADRRKKCKTKENHACVFADYARAAMALAMSLCVRASQASRRIGENNFKEHWNCARVLAQYTRAAIASAISSCVRASQNSEKRLGGSPEKFQKPRMRFCLIYQRSDRPGDVVLRPRAAKFSQTTKHAPKSHSRVGVRFGTCILEPRASGDFALRRFRGGSPKQIWKTMRSAHAFLHTIQFQRSPEQEHQRARVAWTCVSTLRTRAPAGRLEAVLPKFERLGFGFY